MIDEVADRFLSHLKTMRGVSEHTIRNYHSDLQRFFQTMNIDSINEVTRSQLRIFIMQERERGQSKRTVARRVSALRTFFRYCVREKYISNNPMEDIEGPKLDRSVPHSLTYEQVSLFLSLPDVAAYLGLRDRAMMELFYSSGLRLSELVGLNKRDLDLDEMLMRILGKGNKERVIPITENAAQWLQKYLVHPERMKKTSEHNAESDPQAVFLNRFGQRISTRSIDRLFSSYFKRSGFAGTITPHVIRHTIATHWLEQGMDLKTIQLLLGHASMATTTIYTEVSPELKKQAVLQHHPRA